MDNSEETATYFIILFLAVKSNIELLFTTPHLFPQN
jgi:hypothetical protein